MACEALVGDDKQAVATSKGGSASGRSGAVSGCWMSAAAKEIALDILRRLSLLVVRVAFSSDLETCRAKGFEVHQMDQNFMDFTDGEFDFFW